MQGNKALLNDLNVSIDWLSFTLFDFNDVYEVVSFLGFDSSDFIEMPGGGYGYKSKIKMVHANINILYDGADNMGIHVDVSGSGISSLLDAYLKKLQCDTPFDGDCFDLWEETVVSRLGRDVLQHGKFTRVDMAIDDFGARYYTLKNLFKKVENCDYVSLWKRNKNMEEREGLYMIGHTIYFGSNKSDIMMRVYDKQMETNKNRKEDDADWFPLQWVRWELQMRKAKACESMRLLEGSVSLGSVAIGILSHYFRIIKQDDCNKSRCSLDKKWARFVSDVEPLRVHILVGSKTLEDKMKWVDKYVAPTLALISYSVGGDIGYIEDLLNRGACRLRPADLRLLAKERGLDYDDL